MVEVLGQAFDQSCTAIAKKDSMIMLTTRQLMILTAMAAAWVAND